MADQTKPIVRLLLNGASLAKYPRGFADALRRRAEKAGWAPQVEVSKSIEHFNELMTRFSQENSNPVLLGGGDGTFHHAVNHPSIYDYPVSPLPLGTVNAWLRTLGINPRDPLLALERILKGHEVRTRIGVFNRRRFACFASWGFDARVVHKNSPGLKKMVGAASYGATGVLSLLRREAVAGRIILDQEVQPTSATSVIVSRIGNYAGARAFPTGVDGNGFYMMSIRNDSPLSVLAMMRAIGSGALAKGKLPGMGVSASFDLFTELKWKSAKETWAQLDGEALPVKPVRRIRVSLDDRPMRFLVP